MAWFGTRDSVGCTCRTRSSAGCTYSTGSGRTWPIGASQAHDLEGVMSWRWFSGRVWSVGGKSTVRGVTWREVHVGSI